MGEGNDRIIIDSFEISSRERVLSKLKARFCKVQMSFAFNPPPEVSWETVY